MDRVGRGTVQCSPAPLPGCRETVSPWASVCQAWEGLRGTRSCPQRRQSAQCTRYHPPTWHRAWGSLPRDPNSSSVRGHDSTYGKLHSFIHAFIQQTLLTVRHAPGTAGPGGRTEWRRGNRRRLGRLRPPGVSYGGEKGSVSQEGGAERLDPILPGDKEMKTLKTEPNKLHQHDPLAASTWWGPRRPPQQSGLPQGSEDQADGQSMLLF